MLKATIGWTLGLLLQTAKLWKEKGLKGNWKCYFSEQTIRKKTSLITDIKLLVVEIEDQTSHNIPFSQSLIQSRAWILFNSMQTDRWELQKKLVEAGSWGLRSLLHNISTRRKQQVLM